MIKMGLEMYVLMCCLRFSVSVAVTRMVYSSMDDDRGANTCKGHKKCEERDSNCVRNEDLINRSTSSCT